MEIMVTLDTVKAQSQLKTLMQPLRDWAASSSVVHPLPSEAHASHIFGLSPLQSMTTHDMLDAAKRLMDEFHIVVAVRCGVFRISPYVDNTLDEVQELVAALEKVLA